MSVNNDRLGGSQDSLMVREHRAPEIARNRNCKVNPWWVLGGAGVLLAAGGVTMILMGKNVIPVDLHGHSKLVLGLGAVASALGVTGAAAGIILTRKKKNSENIERINTPETEQKKVSELKLKVVSFNVGSKGDWEALQIREDLKRSENWDVHSGMTRAQVLEKTGPHKLKDEEVFRRETEKVNRQFAALLDQFDPDIICLQEYFGNFKGDTEYSTIKQLLTARGYSISNGRDCCVAYKNAVFSNAANFEMRNAGQITSEPKVFALTHTATGKRIKVASHHVPGFDGVLQKQQTNNRKVAHGVGKDPVALSNNPADRIGILRRNERTAGSDVDLELTLQGIEELNPSEETFDVIIHGLDANATLKTSSVNKLGRLHPVRMRLFEYHGYSLDNENQNPTILDGSDFQARKYDYVAAKAKATSVKVEEVIIAGVNNKELLNTPELSMSDHLPILANVTVIF